MAVLSLLPLKAKQAIGTPGLFHNPAHFCVFAVTAVLIASRSRRMSQLIIRFAMVAAFGIVLEGSQATIYGNQFEWDDFGIDCLGAFLGCVIGPRLENTLRF